MGYVRERRIFRLKFADEDMGGLVVRASSVPLGAFLELVELMDVEGRGIGPDDARKVDRLFEGFARALVDWNLEEPEGTPVPATFEGLKRQDIDFAMKVLRAWVEALTSVPDFLPPGSSNGGRSLEPSIPMGPR